MLTVLSVLSGLVLVAFAWVVTAPDRSAFFDLGALRPVDLAIAAAISACRTVILRAIWPRGVLERAFGIEPLAADRPS